MTIILSSISRGLEFWSVKHTSIHEKSDLKVFNDINFLDEICSNRPSDLLAINA